MVFSLAFMPFWLWIVIGIIIAIIIYSVVLDEPTQSEVKKFLKNYGVFILIFIGWILARHYLGYFNQNDFFSKKGNTYAILIFLLWMLAVNFLGKERYVSTQAICDNRSGSCSTYKTLGDYVVLNIGSCDADMFPWSIGHETWIVPVKHFNKINNRTNASRTQIVIKTNVQKCDLLEVPPECHDYIESTGGYNKENIFYGEFSLDELMTEKKIADITGQKISLEEYENKLKDTNRMVNEARAMVKGKTKSILGYISHVTAIQRKARGGEKLIEERREKTE